MTYTFLYYHMPGHNLQFRGEMESQRCRFHIARSGTRCKRRCIIGFEYCHTHMPQALGLQIRPSTLPNAGKGLFAMREFRNEEKICDYNGELIDAEELQERYEDETAPYAVSIDRNHAVDSALERGVGSIANTRPGNQNARLSVNTRLRRCSLVATKKINPGQEIFVSYGRSYRMPDNDSYRYVTVPYKRKY